MKIIKFFFKQRKRKTFLFKQFKFNFMVNKSLFKATN